MKIFVNMISLFTGGPRIVGFGLLEGVKYNSNHSWVILLPQNKGYEDYIKKLNIKSNKNVTILYARYPTSFLKPLVKFFYDQIYTSLYYYLNNINTVFMTANFSCWFIDKKIQVILEHNAMYLQEYTRKYHGGIFKYYLGKYLMKLSLISTPRIIVQLECIKNKFMTQYRYPSDLIKVVTMVPVSSELDYKKTSESSDINEIMAIENKKIKLFFPANYYPGKNHKILFPLAELIRDYSYEIVIFVTLPMDCEFLAEVSLKNLENIIINLGYIENKKINKVYQSVDYLFFPSYVESYGIPYVEAIKNGIPIITADYDFSREICGDSAIFFEQDCIKSLHHAICLAMNKEFSGKLREALSRERLKFQHSWATLVDDVFPKII
jgi:glycosyltransferase involved in cell wall biosynthesis